MSWDRDCQRIEELLDLRGIPTDSNVWREKRRFWDERLDAWFRLRRAGIETPSPLTRFERLAALLSGSPSEATDAFLELAEHVTPADPEVGEAALAALLFQDQIYSTIRAWELCPPPDSIRLWRAIERGTVMMNNPIVFVDDDALLAGTETPIVIFEEVDSLLDLAQRIWG